MSRAPRLLAACGVVGSLSLGVSPGAALAQPAVAPSIRGTAIVHVSPVEGDTLPILCRDADRPELGFTTEMGDAEWEPRLALSVLRQGAGSDQVEVVLELDGGRYTAAFPSGESGEEGYYTAVANVTGQGVAPRMISFTAHCRERLVRGDEGAAAIETPSWKVSVSPNEPLTPSRTDDRLRPPSLRALPPR